jgi:hypothetical protein
MRAPLEPPPDALAAFQSELAGLSDAAVLARFVDPASIVRRVVSTVYVVIDPSEPAGPITLVQPKVLHRHADPTLEALSAGQKALLRAYRAAEHGPAQGDAACAAGRGLEAGGTGPVPLMHRRGAPAPGAV